MTSSLAGSIQSNPLLWRCGALAAFRISAARAPQLHSRISESNKKHRYLGCWAFLVFQLHSPGYGVIGPLPTFGSTRRHCPNATIRSPEMSIVHAAESGTDA